jgi:hypothetical protein
VRLGEQQWGGHGEAGDETNPREPCLGASRNVVRKGGSGGDGNPCEKLEGGEQRGHGEPGG